MMKKYNWLLPTILLAVITMTNVHAQKKAIIEVKIDQLLKKMTLEDKVGQMAQVSIEALGTVSPDGKSFSLDPAKLTDAINKYKIGSSLNTPPGVLLSAAEWNAIQEQFYAATQKNNLKIPLLYGLDDVHGVNYASGTTLFPQEIGQAATWNRQLVYNAAVITAYEGRAVGVPWTFSPVLDLGTNPVWPRIWEGYGEDPYLIGEMGKQFVHGVQDPLGSKDKLAVSLKHYMAYSDPKSGKDRTDAWIPEHYLREYHLPPFAEAIKAGARNVMVNSALINGIPTHINKHVLTDILKNELGFTGFIVTDWQDIENVYRRDKITGSIKDAIMLAINAGIDMSMIPYDYKEFCTDLTALVKEGKVSQARIDDAVRRILRVKFELNLFDTPLTYLKDYPKFGSKEFTQASYNTAAESITLLKNNQQTLPISKNSKVLVTGPNANSMRCLNGGWTYTWQGDKTDQFATQYNTILEAAINKFGKDNVMYEPGVAYKPNGNYYEDSLVNIDAAVNAAANADYILLCIGENSYTETPGNTNDLNLSDNQQALATALSKTGKPIIYVLSEGRPRIINRIEPFASAILDIYLPGNYGADALADILTGDVNPSGKLPITYPRYPNALTNYLHKVSDGDDNPQGGEFNPQYRFGFGLSYTSFSYSDLAINKKSFAPDETAIISVKVTNTGNKAGKDVVQLFTSDLIASITPDSKRLRGFEKIELQPGESKVVEFRLPVKALAFVNLNNKKQLEQGDFKVAIGNLTGLFTVTKTVIF
jgi:beta-glucosidase